MLVHHADPSRYCVVGPVEVYNFVFNDDLTTVWSIHPEENVHQSTFARPIFAKKSKNAPWPKLDRDVIVGQDAWKLFSDVTRGKKDFGHIYPFS
tara:strand:- start:224 stop:505 length:282 start_codon:yes stop_codon:yes gene_type:complete